jgi:hypothetical protein
VTRLRADRENDTMQRLLRVLTRILGVLFVLQGVLWIVAPARAAAGLGMPLLDGLARSTQIGDFSVFFLIGGGTMLVGSRPGWSRLLLVPAAMVGGAAAMRTLAALLHGADFAATFIAAEITMCALLLVAAHRFRDRP